MDAYGFSGKDAKRIGRVVRQVERQSRGGVPPRARWPVGGGGVGGVGRLAKLTHGSIAANSTGTVTLYAYGTTNTLSAETLAVTNPWPDAAANGRKVKIGTVNGVPNCIEYWSCNGA